jgi:hypothetical protein
MRSIRNAPSPCHSKVTQASPGHGPWPGGPHLRPNPILAAWRAPATAA